MFLVFSWPNHFGAGEKSFWMLEPDLQPKIQVSGAGARARALNLISGSADLLLFIAVYDTENAFARMNLANFLRILSQFKPLQISDLMDIIAKLCRCSAKLFRCSNYFLVRKIPFSGCHGNGDGEVNPDGNKQIKERSCLLRSQRRKMNNVIKRPTEQHTF